MMYDQTLTASFGGCRSEFIPKASLFLPLPGFFRLKRGGVLNNAKLAYETWGKLTPTGDNAILILTGLSPDAHVASSPNNPEPGWWEGMVGPGKPIDTRRWFVICVNSLGSCKGSTGPGSVNPVTGAPYRLKFPDLSIEDIADAAAFAVQSMGIAQLACVIGCSMGGMTALSLLSRHPGIARSHINVSGAVHALPFAIAIRSLQREAICTDPNWNEGAYCDAAFPARGMATARKLGVITYRSAEEWDERFARAAIPAKHRSNPAPFGAEFAVESYLQGHADRFLHSYDPNCYLYLSRAIDRFDLGEGYDGCPDAALRAISLDQALVLGVSTDILFPLHQQQQIARGLRDGGARVRFHAPVCAQGHDAFLVETAAFGEPVRAFLQQLACAPAGPAARIQHSKKEEATG